MANSNNLPLRQNQSSLGSPMRPLDGMHVAVTGAAGALGAQVASRLREAGAIVLGIDNVDCVSCDRTIVADLADERELNSVADRLLQEAPDILVNIAEFRRYGMHESQSIKTLSLSYRINLLAPAVLAQAVALPMRERGSGHIVNIGSVLGAIPFPWFVAYSSSKAGLAALSQGLRRELLGTGLVVTHINPRAVYIPFTDARLYRFLESAGIQADQPDGIAQLIVKAIIDRREIVNIGLIERVYALLNIIRPKLIDSRLAGQIMRARSATL